MEALKQLEKEILNEKRLNKENNWNGIGVGKKLKLVAGLVKLHEKVNRFIDGLKAELQLRMPLEYAKKLEKLIQREKEKMNSEFLEILDEEKSLNRIREIIGKKKRELAEKAANPKPSFSAKVSYYENRKLPDKYEENKKMLSAAYSPHNLLLEKVKLKVLESVEFVPDGIQEIQAHFEKMAELVNEAVDEMPRLVVEDPFFKSEEQVGGKFFKKLEQNFKKTNLQHFEFKF